MLFCVQTAILLISCHDSVVHTVCEISETHTPVCCLHGGSKRTLHDLQKGLTCTRCSTDHEYLLAIGCMVMCLVLGVVITLVDPEHCMQVSA